MKKVLIVASVASMIDQFNVPNIELLQSMGYEVHIACNFEKGSTCNSERIQKLKKRLLEMGVKYYQIDFSRSVVNMKEHIRAYNQLNILVKKNQYTFMHCHSPIGGVIGRIVAHQNKVKVIYTAHGFHFFDGAPLKNWLVFYPIEKFFSRWTDVLITINKEDYTRAKKKLHAKKVEYIPGVGVDIEKFAGNQVGVKKKRQELGIDEETIILLSVGELNANKNHSIVIKALAEMKDEKLHYFIAGKGKLKEELLRLAKKLGVEKQVHLLGFRSDIAELMKVADIYILPSLREGLNVSLMEAMASGLSCIASEIRGNRDLIENNKNGYLCDAGNVKSYVRVIQSLANRVEIRKLYGQSSRKKIKKFDKVQVCNRMRKIYGEL